MARSTRDVAARMHGWKCESATFRMNVALSELPNFTVLPKKGNHLTAGIIMAPSLDYMHRAYLDARNGWAKQPIIEMLIPSTLDPSLAPKGKHVATLFCQHFRYDLGPGEAGTRSARRRPTRSSPPSIRMRRASPSRCSVGRSIRRSISSAASG